MSSQPDHLPGPSASTDTVMALRLTRSITATWWYVASGIVLFELVVVLLLVAALVDNGFGTSASVGLGVGGLVWVLSTLPASLAYRRREERPPLVVGRHHLAPLLVGAAFGFAAVGVTGVWAVGVFPLLQVLMLLSWPPGVRLRVVLAATALLVALAIVDVRGTLEQDPGPAWAQLLVMAAALPVVTVSSLWWWDVVVALDRARASEARLAATQERLRLATDVHDLQGHHLQVIALQLELAERLMPVDADAGMEQLRAARGSVDEARQGTRDLATRFRSVPLRDELANAVDLLRAAGAQAEATVDAGASRAPGSTLGPVIRETTTNALRHGGGRWARLSLTHADASWRYEISNDVVPDAPQEEAGSGLDGIARRLAEADGHLEVLRADDTFTVVVTVPGDAGRAG